MSVGHWCNDDVYVHVCPNELLQCWDNDVTASKTHVQLLFPSWLQIRHNSLNVPRIYTKPTQNGSVVPCIRTILSKYVEYSIRP